MHGSMRVGQRILTRRDEDARRVELEEEREPLWLREEPPKNIFDFDWRECLNQIVTLSGLRDIAPASESVVADAMLKLVQGGPRVVRMGGARGFDTMALNVLRRLMGPGEHLQVWVPNTLADQPAEAQAAVMEAKAKVFELHLGTTPGAMLQRNRVMLRPLDYKVDEPFSFYLVAALDRPGAYRGGTAAAVKFAKQLGMAHKILRVQRARGGVD